jgi:hypothetical protein
MKKTIIALCISMALPGVLFGVQGLKKTEPMTEEKAMAILLKANKVMLLSTDAKKNTGYMEYIAFKTIVNSKYAGMRFSSLFTDGGPVAKFYALMGLKILNDPNFEKFSKLYFKKQITVDLVWDARKITASVDMYFDRYLELHKSAYEKKK